MTAKAVGCWVITPPHVSTSMSVQLLARVAVAVSVSIRSARFTVSVVMVIWMSMAMASHVATLTSVTMVKFAPQWPCVIIRPAVLSVTAKWAMKWTCCIMSAMRLTSVKELVFSVNY